MNAWPGNIGNRRLDRRLWRLGIATFFAIGIIIMAMVTTSCRGADGCMLPNYRFTYPGGRTECVCCAY